MATEITAVRPLHPATPVKTTGLSVGVYLIRRLQEEDRDLPKRVEREQPVASGTRLFVIHLFVIVLITIRLSALEARTHHVLVGRCVILISVISYSDGDGFFTASTPSQETEPEAKLFWLAAVKRIALI